MKYPLYHRKKNLTQYGSWPYRAVHLVLVMFILLCTTFKSSSQNSYNINSTSFYNMVVQPDFCQGSYMHIKIGAFVTSVYDDHIWEMQVRYKKRFEPASTYVLLATLKSTFNGSLSGSDTTIYKSAPSGVQSGVRIRNEQEGSTLYINRSSEYYTYSSPPFPRTVNLDCINLLWFGIPDSLQGTELDIELSGTWRYGNNSHSSYIDQNIGSKEIYGYVQKPANAPFGLMASTNQCNKVNLSWSNPVRESCNSTQGSWITEVYRNNTYIGKSIGNATTFTDSTVTAGVSYTYKVRGGYLTKTTISTGLNIIPLLSNFSPTAAGNSQAPLSAPTSVSASNTRCDGKIAVTWNFTSDPQKFIIQRKLNSQPVSSFVIIDNNVSGNSRLYNDGTVTKGIQYNYRLIAVDNCNNSSPVSGSSTGIALLSPSNPTSINIQGASNNSVLINWNDPNPSGPNNENNYILEKYVTGNGNSNLINITLDSNTTQFVDNDLISCLTYRYTVKAGSSCAPNGSDNDTFRYVKLPPPGLTTAFNTTNNKLKTSKGYYGDRIELTWQTGISESLNSFLIFRKQASSPNDSVLIATVNSSQAIYTDVSATAGTLYRYTIIGRVSCGNEVLYTNTSEDIGFRSPAGIVNGSVNYTGGFAVEDVRVLATSTTGGSGSSLFFDGNDYLMVPNKNNLVNSQGFSAELWVRPTTLLNTICFITNTTNINTNGFRLSYIPADTNSRIEFTATVDSSGVPLKRTAAAMVNATNFAVNNYHHLGIVYQNDSLFLYLNGVKVAATANGNILLSSNDPLLIGASNTVGYNDNMRGNIDEVRLWKVAKTEEDVLRDFNRFVNPDDSRLSGYWSFDENISGLTSFFDQSNNNQLFNENHGIIGAAEWSSVVPNPSQLSMAAYTDASGNYTISNIRYTGIGQNFTVTPSISTHSFSPSNRIIFVGDNAKVFNGIDFSDISSFTVTGSVYYAGTACAAKDIFIRIDGNTVVSVGEPVVTDANGQFTIQVPIGNHVVSLYKEGHTFNQGRFPATGSFNFQAPVSGILFYDTTLITLVGRVVGGIREGNKLPGLGRSINNIGQATISLTAQNASCINRIIQTDSATGEYKILLPPLKYVVNSLTIPSDLSISFGTQDLLDLSNTIIKQSVVDTVFISGTNAIQQIDTTSYHVRRDFIYRTIPSINVTQADKISPFTGDREHIIDTDTISLINDPFGFPIFTCNQTYNAHISVFESYVNKDGGVGNYIEDKVPVTDGKLVINNNLGQGTTEEIILDKGDTVYSFLALLPNVLADINNPQYSYTKTFQIIAQTGPYAIEWKPFTGRGDYFRGFVFGSRSDGNAFTTVGPELVDFVLRDPPGSNSYAYIDQGYSRTEYKSWNVATNAGANIHAKFRLGTSFTIGFGFETATDIYNDIDINTTLSTKITPAGRTSTTTTYNSKFSTSSSSGNVGADADLFVGKSQNILYGVARDLSLIPDSLCGQNNTDCYGSSINGKRIGVTYSMFIIPEGNNTTFVYSQEHIEKNIIPNLILLRNQLFLSSPQKYVSNIPLTHANYGTNNDDPVWAGNVSSLVPLITEDKDTTGQSYTYFQKRSGSTAEVDSVRYFNQQIRLWIEALANNEKEKIEAQFEENISFNGSSQIEKSINVTSVKEKSVTYEFIANNEVSFIMGMRIAGTGFETTNSVAVNVNTSNEEGSSDEYTTTYGYVLKDAEDGDNLSVDIKKPGDGFGPVFKTIAGQTSCPYEGRVVTKYYLPGTVIGEATMARDEPVLNVAPTRLQNVPSDEQAVFNLSLGNASPSGDSRSYTLSVVESTNPHGAILEIDGASPNRSFSIPAGTSINKILTVKRGPVAYQYDNIRLQLKSNCDAFVDTINISVHYLASCSPVSFIKPEDKWVLNNSNNDSLPVIIGGYDINYATLERLRFQYKPINSSQWINLQNFWKDTSGMNDPSLEPISQTNFYTQYNWDFSQLPDGKYDIRAVSNCPLADVTTATFTGTADRVNPHPFGNPSPANGILTANDDISIQFNEPIDEAFLAPLNIDIRGVLNGTDIRNASSILFDGDNDYLEIPDGLNISGGELTIEFWAKRNVLNSRQVVLSQGSTNSSQLTIGFAADNKFYFGVGSDFVYSTFPINDTTQFKHYAVSYNQTTHTILLFIDGALVNNGSLTFNPVYNENGKTYIGKAGMGSPFDFNGNIHELRVWNRARSLNQIIATMTQTLTGREGGIQGNWRMDEAEGSLAKDFIKNRHGLIHNAIWQLTPSGFAYSFNGGSAFVSAPSATVALNNEMDFTIEFWFKGANGNNITLLGNGKGDSAELNAYGKWSIGTNALGQLEVRNNGQYFLATNQNYFDDNWHHFALVMNRSTSMVAFVDGNPQNNILPAGFGEFGGAKIWIGARGWNNVGTSQFDSTDRYFTGAVDEVRIWNTARLHDQITRDKQNRLSANEPGLLFYIPFEVYSELLGVPVLTPSTQIITSANDALNIYGNSAYTNHTPNIRLQRATQKVNFTYSLNNDKIVITPTTDAAQLEKVTLDITVSGLKDLNGNSQQSPKTWVAYVNKNQVVWQDAILEYENKSGEPLSFSSAIINSGGVVKSYQISNLPSWLTVDAASGTAMPNSVKAVTFTVNPNMNTGTYEEDILLTNDLGYAEKLTVLLKVYTPSPSSWMVDAANYQYNMSIVAQIRIDGEISNNTDNIIAAFVDNECRGTAQLAYYPQFDKHLIFMDIYSDSAAGETVQFRIWNADQGKVHTEIDSNILFNAFTLVGNVLSPQIFSTTDYVARTLTINSGWNWLSFGLQMKDSANINNALRYLGANNGDILRSQTQFVDYTEGIGWSGSLNTLKPEPSYRLKSSVNTTLVISGKEINPLSRPISIYAGWNWIGFIPSKNMLVNDALGSFTPTNGDVVRSQTQFAIYDANMGWIGSLTSMKPNMGYMYKAASPGTLVYPTQTSFGKNMATEDEPTYLSVDASAYANSMNLILTTDVCTKLTASGKYHLAAYVGNELRGIAKANTHSYFFLTVYSNTDNEVLLFKLINTHTGAVISMNEVHRFQNMGVEGSLNNPLSLTSQHLVSCEEDETHDMLRIATSASVHVYPVPFHNSLNIDLQLGYSSEVNIALYSIEGKKVSDIASNQKVENKSFVSWNDALGMSPGVYFIEIQTAKETLRYKLVKE